jgi:hypothetical protein
LRIREQETRLILHEHDDDGMWVRGYIGIDEDRLQCRAV